MLLQLRCFHLRIQKAVKQKPFLWNCKDFVGPKHWYLFFPALEEHFFVVVMTKKYAVSELAFC